LDPVPIRFVDPGVDWETGSGSKKAKMSPLKSEGISCFEVLDVLFGEGWRLLLQLEGPSWGHMK
jgi:hypothetical protein